MSGEGMRKSVRRKETGRATKHQGQLREPQSPAFPRRPLWPQRGSLRLLTPVTGMPY